MTTDPARSNGELLSELVAVLSPSELADVFTAFRSASMLLRAHAGLTTGMKADTLVMLADGFDSQINDMQP